MCIYIYIYTYQLLLGLPGAERPTPVTSPFGSPEKGDPPESQPLDIFPCFLGGLEKLAVLRRQRLLVGELTVGKHEP